jgi:predicted secreted protein
MTMYLRRGMSVVASVAVLVSGLALGAGSASAAQHYRVVATDPARGAHIKVPYADSLILRLKACESCGYTWKITRKPDPSVMKFDRRLSSQGACKAPCTGGNVHERFRFVSRGKGTTIVKLGYFPPGKHAPSKVLRLHLAVI